MMHTLTRNFRYVFNFLQTSNIIPVKKPGFSAILGITLFPKL
jgi:hypothetical protein